MLPPEAENFHANKTCPKGTIKIGYETLLPYVDNKKDLPIEFYFNGQWPSLSFSVDDNFIYGDIPINPTLIQKHMYEKGSRYWKRWTETPSKNRSSKNRSSENRSSENRSSENRSSENELVWVVPIISLLAIAAIIAVYYRAKYKYQHK